MIGNDNDEPRHFTREKMVMNQMEDFQALLKERGIGKVIAAAADMIVNLQIELMREKLLNPKQLDGGKAPEVPSATKGARG